MKLNFICPHCKKKQFSVLESQEGYQTYEYNFEAKQWDTKYDFEGQNCSWQCPECNQDITPDVLPKSVQKELGWQS